MDLDAFAYSELEKVALLLAGELERITANRDVPLDVRVSAQGALARANNIAVAATAEVLKRSRPLSTPTIASEG